MHKKQDKIRGPDHCRPVQTRVETAERIAKVTVIGTKLPTGEFIAREVILGGGTGTAADRSNVKQSDKRKAEHKH